jgi:hypothetical protein
VSTTRSSRWYLSTPWIEVGRAATMEADNND